MIVKEMIEAIEKGELKIKDLASQFGFSDRTIQTKIKKLGFKWDSKKTVYEFIGEDKEVYNMPIEDLFRKAVNAPRKADKAVKGTSKVSPKKAPETSPEAVREVPKKVSKSASEMDSIDKLLAGKKAKREYKGYYFDRDILEVLDSLKHVNKSDLINECLRKVFKDKGLL